MCEAIGTLFLVLEGGFNLYLNNTLYVPSMTRNLISVSKLDRFGYDFKFGHNGLKVYFDSHFIGAGSLDNDLYKFNLENNFEKSLLSMDVNVITNGKRKNLEK